MPEGIGRLEWKRGGGTRATDQLSVTPFSFSELAGCSILKDARDRRRVARMIIESGRSGGGLNCYEWVVMDVDMIVESP
ncbi:hypothetical protein TNCV_601671 [Trichonephila clavipes]|nr:hypothetical protein TNCV_601671 [Trichonephila clavipes]